MNLFATRISISCIMILIDAGRHYLTFFFDRRLSAEYSRSRDVCNSVGAQLASLPDVFSASSLLNFSSPAVNGNASHVILQPAESSSAAQDWMASVELKLKLFESQTSMVSQASHVTQVTLFTMLKLVRRMPNFARILPQLSSRRAHCKSFLQVRAFCIRQLSQIFR